MTKDDIIRLGWNMDRLVGLRRALINREADENGVYLGQHRVLRHIAMHPGCSQREIAQALTQTPAAVTLSTKRLQELGLITKRTNPDNLRQYHLYITEKGKQNGESFMKVIDRYANLTFDGFSEEELELLSGLIEKMYINLKPFREDACCAVSERKGDENKQ